MKILRPLKKDQKIKPYAVVDTETWALGGKLAFGCVYINDREYDYFKTKEQFYAIIKKRKINIVYCHNLDFDAIKIRGLSSVENTIEPIYAGGLLIRFKDKRGLEWRDSYALLKSNVDNLGLQLGYKKGITPQKFIEPTPETSYVSSTDQKYCKRDCKIIAEYLKIFFDLTGAQKLTVASSCMFIFRRQFLKNDVIINDLHREFKNSYYGGRVECFRTGKVKAQVNDVNSMYPAVMENIKLPDPSKLISCTPDLKTFYTILNNYEGCATVKVEHPKQKIGMLPYRMNDKLTFPAGKFEGCWNLNELRFAVSKGVKILKVKKVVYATENLENFFTDYVQHFYNLKNTTKGALKLLYKFYLNTLYGKFGENSHSKRIYCKSNELFTKVLKLEKEGKTFAIHELKRNYYYIDISADPEKEPIHTCFNFCSYITSAARVELLKGLLENEKTVVYCDTDSIATEGEFIGKMSNKLGEWAKEEYSIERIVGNKFYKTDKGMKAKGIPKRAVLQGRQFIYEHFIKSKESINRGLEAGTTEQRFKNVSFDYDKRVKKRNGDTEIIVL